MTWLDALFGRLFSKGVPVDLAGGLNFTDGLKASYNQSTNRNDVSIDGLQTAPYSIDDAGASLTVDETGAAVAWVASPFVTPEQFGAIGDGLNNDRVAMLAAAAASVERGVELLLRNRYLIAGELVLPSGIRMRGVGEAAAILQAHVTVSGSFGPELPFLSATAANVTSIPVSTTSLVAGDHVRLASCINAGSADAGEYQLSIVDTDYSCLAEFVTVETVTSSTAFTAVGSTLWPYSNTPGGDSYGSHLTSVARKVSFATGYIKSLAFEGVYGASTSVIALYLCRGFRVSGCRVDNGDAANVACIVLEYCEQCSVEGGEVIGSLTTASTVVGNAIRLLSCSRCEVAGVGIRGSYQGGEISYVPLDYTYRGGPSVACSFDACIAKGAALDGFTSDSGCFASSFTSCTVSGCFNGLRLRDRNSAMRCCTLLGGYGALTGAGVYVLEFAVGSANVQANTIRDYQSGVHVLLDSDHRAVVPALDTRAQICENNISVCSVGIRFATTPASALLINARVFDNRISHCASSGIYIFSYNNGVTITGNQITNVAASASGIRYAANSSDLRIYDNHVYDVPASGYAVQGGTVSYQINDLATWPSGDAEARLYLGRVHTDAATPFVSVVTEKSAHNSPLISAAAPVIESIGSSYTDALASNAFEFLTSYVVLDTEGAAATDELDSITGGSVGDLVHIRPQSTSRVITIRSGTGNITTPGGEHVVLNSSLQVATLLKITSTAWRVLYTDPLIYATTATIASGVITCTTGRMIIDTEGAAASDDLTTINGGVEGRLLELTIASGSRTVTLLETGNIRMGPGSSLLLDGIFQCVTLRYHATYWLVTSNEGGTYA